MNLRCFFGHKYSIIKTHAVSVFEDDTSQRPSTHQTTFLFRCSKCGDLYSKRITGYFPDKDDDDDDDGHQDPQPILSPDDFYESLNK